MRPSSQCIDPPVSVTVIIGILIAAIWSAIYLVHPDFIAHLQFKLTDAIVADIDGADISGEVAVVNVDERSLETWGQWPWPRSRLAKLLGSIADMGARCIVLDFIMAEPDRTSFGMLQGHQAGTSAATQETTPDPATLPDNDAILAATLASGRFVLGYEFQFSEKNRSSNDCHLHPLEIVNILKPSNGIGNIELYQAQGAVCNLVPLARAASYSGFLNGQPDGDGRLRRLPLMIRYGEAVYPNLALAALLSTGNRQPVMLRQRLGEQSSLVLGRHTIPIDANGNLRIHFSAHRSNLHQITAESVLNGQVAEAEIRDRVVLVGLSASGLSPAYLTPCDGLFSAVEVHAQAIETILSQKFIRRQPEFVFIEVILSMLLAALFSLCVARFEFATTAAIGLTGGAALWAGAQLLFSSHRILLSPLLPVAVILSNGILLILFKYWERQRKARRHMQDALVLVKSSEKNLNAIIKTIPDIVFRLDPSGRITFISPALANYQKHPDDMIGTHILDLVATPDRDAAVNRINERRTGTRRTTDLQIRLLLSPEEHDESGEGRYFSVSAEGIYSQVPPDSQSFSGTQGIARDIDDRKHLEKKLEQSKQMEAIGSLAAGVAHDLNNILSGLVSYPELLLLDLPSDSPMREKIETIQRSGQRAAEIVQDMLMIARRGVKNHGIISLNDVIDSYLEAPECKRLMENHAGIRVTTELAGDLMNVKGSPVHMSKVVMNLLGNAAEAMPAGGSICIATLNRYLDTVIDCYERIPEGEYVLLRITDEGVGIPDDELHRIFEPFFSKKRMGRSGSGLGMTVIWSTIKDHGGYVDIQSREGHGTRFDIYLPATRKESSRTRQRVVLQDYTGTERVLVVDDIPEQLDIAVQMLGKLGYQVASASGGEEAVTYMQTHTVDILVLDMVMPPGIDGLDTYQRILACRPGQKAIIASGYASTDRVKVMQNLGAGEYIRKPYTMEKIGLAVRRELDRN